MMLALSRGAGQSIIIDGAIEVKVVKWNRTSVRLAIQAPREVAVNREEIWRLRHPGEATPLEKADGLRQRLIAPQKADHLAQTSGPGATESAASQRQAIPADARQACEKAVEK